MRLRIATRRSALARAQAFQTGLALRERTGADFELVPLATSGDLAAGVPVEQVDVKGMFVDTVRRAVLDGDCHLAVHSYKDLPTAAAPGLVVAAVPPREDPRDVLVSRDGHGLATLPPLARVGTSSQRRRLQLLRAKPGLQVLAVRGNLDTRLRKVAAGDFDAVVVAHAGLRRLFTPPEAGGVGPLGLPLKAVALEPGECLPAAGQGALAVECRADDEQLRGLLAAISSTAAERAVTAERAFLEAVGGGCLAAVGALCAISGDRLELAVMAGDPARRLVVRRSGRAGADEPAQLGRRLAADVRAALEAA